VMGSARASRAVFRPSRNTRELASDAPFRARPAPPSDHRSWLIRRPLALRLWLVCASSRPLEDLRLPHGGSGVIGSFSRIRARLHDHALERRAGRA
jgi:hypothetical protein